MAEYVCCGLEHYKTYNFKLYAKNDDKKGTEAAQKLVKSGEGGKWLLHKTF